MQGLFSNVLNPKTVLVYITIMPQFINLRESVNQQLIILALILTFLAVFWFLILVYLIDFAKMAEKREIPEGLSKAAGLVLVGFGVKTGLD